MIPMAKTEQTYTIPLRRSFVKVPKYLRAKRAIATIKNYIVKHTHVEDVKLGNKLNELIWENGIKNPPGKVTVKAILDGTTVKVELEGHDYKVQKVQTEKTEQPTSLPAKLAANLKVKDEPVEAEKETADVAESETKEVKPATKKAVKKTAKSKSE